MPIDFKSWNKALAKTIEKIQADRLNDAFRGDDTGAIPAEIEEIRRMDERIAQVRERRERMERGLSELKSYTKAGNIWLTPEQIEKRKADKRPRPIRLLGKFNKGNGETK